MSAQMTPPAPLGVRDILRIRNYRLLWTGQLVSEVGDGLTNLTLLLLVNHLTGSTAALAAMAIVLAIPPLTIGLFAGAWVDRVDRRRIMLASDLLRAVAVLGFLLVGSVDNLWLLYGIAFVQSAIGTFFTPARGAILPRLVPREGLLAANSLAQATRVVASVAGAGLAGLIVGVGGTFGPAFVIDSLSFLASFVLISRLPVDSGRIEQTGDAPAAGGNAMTAGLRTIGRSRVLSTTVLALAVSMLGLGAVNVLFVPFVVGVLDVGPVWLGPVELAQSSSMILASGFIVVLARRLSSSTIVTIGMAGIAVVIALAGSVGAIWQLLVLMFAIGWFVSPLQAAVVTILQSQTPDAERGRVMAVLQAAMSAASVLSMGLRRNRRRRDRDPRGVLRGRGDHRCRGSRRLRRLSRVEPAGGRRRRRGGPGERSGRLTASAAGRARGRHSSSIRAAVGSAHSRTGVRWPGRSPPR